jgi:endonuclease/exonuclease/phosphatase family metal-dependent hydrolase
VKIAAFNVENLFDRAKAFNEDDEDVAQGAIEAVAELNVLFEKEVYEEADKARMLALVEELGLNRYDEGPFALIRKIRGAIFRRPRAGGIKVIATGRDSWIGWAELKTAHVNEIAVMNTGRVIRDVDADILAVVEAENRVALRQFSEYVFEKVKDEVDHEVQPYAEIMLVDGNDTRGIDVGLMTKKGFRIGTMRSHVHDLPSDVRKDELGDDALPADLPPDWPVFSRDCPEYAVTTPDGEIIWIIPNHFKSKYGGNSPRSRAKREAQAIFARVIYERLRRAGFDNVIVLGDLNDTPDSEPLQPLLANSDLRDVSELELFDTGEFTGRPGTDERGIGTYGLGNDGDKIDYLLLSPALWERVTAAGLFRKGAWPGSRPPRWTVYPQLKKKVHVASDHHVIWVEID